MVQPPPPTMLQRLFGRREGRRREPEPADLGTAFGMEQTLDQPQWPQPVADPDSPYAWLSGSRGTRKGT